MKKITLTFALLTSTLLIAGIKDTKEPIKVTEKERLEIKNTSSTSVYFWEVKTISGLASGYTSSKASAEKAIKLLSVNDAVTYKIIEQYK